MIGYLAGTATTISFLPQAIQVVRTGTVEGISPLLFMIHSTGVLSWIVYGVILQNQIIILFNSITLFLNIIILSYLIHQRCTTSPRTDALEIEIV